MSQKTIILGKIGEDAHNQGMIILGYALEKAGLNVVSLGIYNKPSEFIDAAIETSASAILVSSSYGMGELDCQDLREKCIEKGIGNIRLYIGGQLVVGKRSWEETEAKFKAMGFNRVYPPTTLPSVAIRDLKQDLGIPG